MIANDSGIPHQMRVPCYNQSDGCKNTVSYIGVKPVRKLCSACLESGTPSTRPQVGFNFEKATRNLRASPQWMDRALYSDGYLCYEITVQMKTFSGGRVMPCRTEG